MRFACARIRTSLLCITTSRISTLAFSSLEFMHVYNSWTKIARKLLLT